MMYTKWDEVVLKLDDCFGYKDKVVSYLKVMVLGIEVDFNGDHTQYLCYVSPNERIPHGFPTFVIDRYHARHFHLEPKFIGDTGCFITGENPILKRIPAPKGEKCDRCRTFFEGAERDDEGNYRCRACRENPWR